MFSKEIFASRLRQIRISRGITAVKSSTDLGLSRAAISQFESGVNLPTSKTLYALADYFDVSLDYLTGRSNDATPLSYRSCFQLNFSKRISEIIPTLNEEDLKSLGISKDELYNLSDLDNKITFNEACNVANKLGISLDYLVGLSN